VEGNRNNYLEYQVNLLPTMQSHAITDPLINGNYFVLLAGAHGIRVSEDLASELTVTTLMSTSSSSYAKSGTNSNTQKEAGDIDGPFATAVLSTKDEDNNMQSSVIWVSSPTLINEDVNDYVSGGNMDMFLNMLGFLADPEAAEMTIHAKPLSNVKYLVMGNNAALALKLLVVAIIPLGYLAIGTLIWYRRKKQ
jgi:ABC-2 type transport system permease protein